MQQIDQKYPVRINRKMAEDWKDRFDGQEDIPTTPGIHLMTRKEIVSLIAFLQTEISDFRDYGATEWADMIAAAERQRDRLVRDLASIPQ